MTNPIISKNITYSWQYQPYISWKGNNYNMTSFVNSRPETNGSWNKSGNDGNAFLARPIKHWRKQLAADKIRGGTANISIQDINGPGLYTLINKECCDVSNNSSSIISYIQEKNNSSIYDNSESIITQTDILNCWNGPLGKRICCNPEANLIKYKTVPLERNYISYTSYFKNRCYNYNQNISTTKIEGNTYFTSDGMATYPTDLSNGCQNLQKRDCVNNCCRCNCENSISQNTIYKPNNRQFSTQGGTSGKSRINAFRENTINPNGALFNNAHGLKQINNGICGLNGDSLYYVKTKPTPSPCSANCVNNTDPVDPTEPTINFVKAVTNFTTNRGISVTYGNNIWIAVGRFNNNKIIARSTDGINWTTVGITIPTYISLYLYGNNILNNGDTWVVVCESNKETTRTNFSILYSIDNGINWMSSKFLSPAKLFSQSGNSIAYDGNGRWVAVGSGDNTILTTTDVSQWSSISISQTFAYGREVVYNDNLWVVVGKGNNNTILTSTNGISWSTVSSNEPYTRFEIEGYSVAYGNGLWVAVGGTIFTPPNLNTILYSTNGTQWLPVDNIQFESNDTDYYGNFVTYGNGLWVAVGKGVNTILTSTNGSSWSPVDTTEPYTQFTEEGISVRYQNGVWVAVGKGENTILTSTNGTQWLPTDTQFSIYSKYDRTYNPIAYGNGRWVIIGQNNIYYSN